jgi:hypothetical protein
MVLSWPFSLVSAIRISSLLLILLHGSRLFVWRELAPWLGVSSRLPRLCRSGANISETFLLSFFFVHHHPNCRHRV